MFLLETDTLINIIRQKPNVIANLEKHKDIPKAFSIISYGELVYGCRNSPCMADNFAKLKHFKKYYPIVNLNRLIMDCFGDVKAQLKRVGTPVDDMDLLIGCTALVMNYTIVTSNVKHFEKIPGLNVVNWM